MWTCLRDVRPWLRGVLAGGLLTLGAFGGWAAGPLEDGITAYKRGDYAAAMRLWRPLADQGQADAQYCLGSMYRVGKGVPQDYAAAIALWRPLDVRLPTRGTPVHNMVSA
jgi:hypothetical protein